MTDITQPNPEQPSAEEIARHYSAAMDSVNLINAGKPEHMTDQEWEDTVKRNKEHLNIMIGKTWWTADYDLSPLETAAE